MSSGLAIIHQFHLIEVELDPVLLHSEDLKMKILRFEISGIAHSHYDEEKCNCCLLSIHSYLCRSYKAWAIASVIPHFPNSIGIYSFCLPQASLL